MRGCYTGLERPAFAAAFVEEDLLDAEPEQPRQPQCQRKRGVVLAGLDRVDRLARHSGAAAELGLAPAALGPKHPQTVAHLRPPSQPSLTICQLYTTRGAM